MMGSSTDTIEEVEETSPDDDGVDNPFRPGGGLSKEADLIVELIKAGQTISPTSPTREDIVILEEIKQRQIQEQHEQQQQQQEPLLSSSTTGSQLESDNVFGKRCLKEPEDKKNLDRNKNFSPNNNNNNNTSPSSSRGSKKRKAPSSTTTDGDTFDADKKKDAKRACCVIT